MTQLKKTPLNQWHHENGARMVEFCGWDMPVQYEGIIAEHKATRTTAGLFDVSHMGEIFLRGPDALSNLQNLLPNDPSTLKIGQVQYSPLLTETGAVVDDLSIYKFGEEEYLLCVNASNVDKDFAWIQSHLSGDVKATNESDDFSQIAIQGPKAEEILSSVLGLDFTDLKYWWFQKHEQQSQELIIARMGYTGERGFEIFCPNDVAVALWEELMAAGKELGIQPIGLGARDTLRMEVCFPLYGQELTDSNSILGAKVGRFLKLDKPFDFIGKKALLASKEAKDYNQLVFLELVDKGVPRSHYPVLDAAGETIGEVTSGNMSPMLGRGIAIASVKKDQADATEMFIQVRNKNLKAQVVKGPFVPTKK